MCVFVFVWPEGSSVFILFRTGTSQAESAYRYMSIHAHAHTHIHTRQYRKHANTENTLNFIKPCFDPFHWTAHLLSQVWAMHSVKQRAEHIKYVEKFCVLENLLHTYIATNEINETSMLDYSVFFIALTF